MEEGSRCQKLIISPTKMAPDGGSVFGDAPPVLSLCRVVQALHLEALQERPWQIAPTNGLTGDGLDKAMEWLADRLMRS